MSDVALTDIDITGIDEYPANESVKLNGPPGTGKTTESAARVAKLLEEYDYTIDNVLWATYRKSLATETLERLASWDVIDESELEKPKKGDTRFIGTIHAVGNRLIGGVGDTSSHKHEREFARERGLRYDKQSPWDEPPGELLFDVFQYAANNLLDLHNQAERDQIPKLEDLQQYYRGDIGRAWDDWQTYKEEHEVVDFWEQLAEPLRRGVTPDHDVVVIDEYHDAYPLMARLAESWIESAEVAIVAGDPLQVVNTYAGADPVFYRGLDLPEVQLPTAHKRPPKEHWAVATSLLSNAHTPPPLETDNSGAVRIGPSPTLSYDSDKGWQLPEAAEARSPAWFVNEHGTDTMFLTRTQKQATGIARALEKAGVLYETQNSMDIDGWGARDSMSDRTAVYNALQKLADIKPEASTTHGLSRYHGEDDTSVRETVFRHQEAAGLLDHARAKYLSENRSDITDIANGIEASETPVDGGELSEHVKPEFWEVYGRAHGSVRHLIKTSQRAEGENLKDTDFRALRAALRQNDEPVLSVDTLVYTIHASKGSEARNVVVYDGITNRIRSNMRQDERERKNEWRTWYVALTRSRANLFVLRDAFPWTVPFLPDNLMAAAKDLSLIHI